MTIWEQDAPRPHLSPPDATPSPGGIDFRSVLGWILECLESPGRRACRPRLGYFRRQAEVAQDSLRLARGIVGDEDASGAGPSRAGANQWAELMRRTFAFDVYGIWRNCAC